MMSTWILLHGKNTGAEFHVNVNQLAMINVNSDGASLWCSFNDEDHINVRESVEEIFALIAKAKKEQK